MTETQRSWRAEVEAADPGRVTEAGNPDAYEFGARKFKRREGYGEFPINWEDHTTQTWNAMDGFQYWRTLG